MLGAVQRRCTVYKSGQALSSWWFHLQWWYPNGQSWRHFTYCITFENRPLLEPTVKINIWTILDMVASTATDVILSSFQFPVRMASQHLERPIDTPHCPSEVSPRLPWKLYQCLSGWTQIIQDLRKWNVSCFLSLFFFPSGSQNCDLTLWWVLVREVPQASKHLPPACSAQNSAHSS